MSIDFTRFSLPQIREFLIDEGYDPDTVNPLKRIALVGFIQSENLEQQLSDYYPKDEPDVFEEAELEDNPKFSGVESLGQVLSEPSIHSSLMESSTPRKGSPEWNDYVLKLFTEDEYVDVSVDGGNHKIKGVKCDGLRRVAQLVLGEFVRSGPVQSHVEYPSYDINGKEQLVKMQTPPCAWVRYEIEYLPHFSPMRTTVIWGGLADVNYANTDPKFIPFALATAETRAEARALRKALGIKILAAEELTNLDTASKMEVITNADWSPGLINDAQKAAINRMAQKLKISVYKLINCDRDSIKSGPLKYTEKDIRNDSLDALNNEAAIKVIALLNEIQQSKKEVDDSVKES